MNNVSLPPKAALSIEKAQLYLRQKNYLEAHNLLKILIQQYPASGEVNLLLGNLYLNVEDFDSAITHLSHACQLLPNNFHALFSLMEAFEQVNAHQDVKTVNDFMLKQFPKTPEVLYKAAQYFSEIGQVHEAIKYCRLCIGECETQAADTLLQAYAWMLLIKVDSKSHCADTIARLQKLHTTDTEKKELSMLVNYAKGEVFHQLKQASKAFTCWQIANDIQYRLADFKTKDMSRFYEQIIASDKIARKGFAAHQNLNKDVSDTLVPIFIVGLPRTGSTLLETMLCEHGQIDTVGESTIVSGQIATYLAQYFKADYPTFMEALSLAPENGEACIQGARRIYYQAIAKRQITARYIIDKLPANFQSLGLIKRIFPNAKIIHMQRDFKDVALSIFRHHFASNEPYFCNLAETKAYNDLYSVLMKYWEDVWAEQIFNLNYEDLVTQPKESISAVLNYCGLAFDAACVRERQQDSKFVKPIKTLSANQARLAITSSYVGLSEMYHSLLGKGLNGTAI